MNFRRGLFRAWIGFSLIWVCLIGVIFFADGQKYFKPIRLTVADSNFEFPGTTSRGTVKAALLEFLKHKTIKGAVLSQNDAEQTAIEISQKFTSKDFPEFILQTSPVLVLPPAILFVFGALLLWIGAGFRRQSASPGTR
jgi:hypothetical protein